MTQRMNLRRYFLITSRERKQLINYLPFFFIFYEKNNEDQIIMH